MDVKPCYRSAELNAALAEARGWLQDCGADTTDMPDSTVVTLVHRNFVGGWPEFIKADDSIDEIIIWAMLVMRFGEHFIFTIYRDGVPER
jgi:hypothetical protein